MTKPFLSIIIPAYNEATRLPGCLHAWQPVLEELHKPYEILIVENGSADDTYNVALNLRSKYPHVSVTHIDRRGKGAAIRLGMLLATGWYRYMADMDLSTPPEFIEYFLRSALNNYDITIGSREVPGAQVTYQPRRRMMGRIFHAMVRLSTGLDVRDTQCGFKMFRGSVADDLFGCQTMDEAGFDVEILYLARRRGYSIREMPVIWDDSGSSVMHLWRDSLRMARDVMRVRWLHRNVICHIQADQETQHQPEPG